MNRIKIASLVMTMMFVLSACDRGMDNADNVPPQQPTTPQQP